MDNVFELYDYLPIEEVEISDYIKPLFESAHVTYDKEQYQFSYFAIHLIFMTFIYSTVWKIAQFHKDKYEHSLLFARPYNGKEVDLKTVGSVFEYSNLPEKDIFEFFALIDLDNSYIKSTKKLIDYRNEMAHATGKIEISSEEKFDLAIDEILSVSAKIHEKLSVTIRDWYRKELKHYAKNELDGQFGSITDYINSVFIGRYSFSQNELLVCKEFGLRDLKSRRESGLTVEEVARVVDFHETVKEKYADVIGEEYVRENEEATA